MAWQKSLERQLCSKLLMQRPENKVQDRLKNNSRVWDRANTIDERRQEHLSIGVPLQLVIEEGRGQ